MAGWYKHDIAAWMDGTEELDHEPYRVYHVICQLIYLNEAPIKINASGIAGRCKMSVRAFQKAFEFLISEGFISVESDRISNSRATKELEKMGINRENAAKGGKAKAKSLENNRVPLASLPQQSALRLEETRLEKKDGAPAPVDPPDKAFFQRSRQVLGPKAGGSMGARILKAYDGNISRATVLIENASQKDSPIEYVSKALHNMHNPENGLHPRF